ncbi:MAG: hypothetical protein ACREU5_10280 [Burkholderiales bacterium]
MNRLKLNGWQRLWIAFAGITLIALFGFAIFFTYGLGPNAQLSEMRKVLGEILGLGLIEWAILIASIYAAGWIVGWIVRGFRNRDV